MEHQRKTLLIIAHVADGWLLMTLPTHQEIKNLTLSYLYRLNSGESQLTKYEQFKLINMVRELSELREKSDGE